MSCFCLRLCPGLDWEEHRLWCWKEEEARKVAFQKEEVVLQRRLHEKTVVDILAGAQILDMRIDPGNQ